MPADDLMRLEDRLNDQLKSYDWQAVGSSVSDLAAAIDSLKTPVDERMAKRMIGQLRESRRFQEMLHLSDAVIRSKQSSPQIRRQMAQAYIDLGQPAPAKFLLEKLIADPATPASEHDEAWGLIGRWHKQAYVDVENLFHEGRPADLDKAIEAYEKAYQANPDVNYWQGINTAALLNRRGDVAAAARIARCVLDALEKKERSSTESSPPAWDVATRMEACVALGRRDDAVKAAEEYVRSADVNAFALEGTRRQMEEVWKLTDVTEPGSRILPLLRGALLQRKSGGIRIQASAVRNEFAGLEKRLGPEGSQPLSWLKLAFDRCKAVARIEKGGKGVGTGWLVASSDFFKDRPKSEMLLLTNAHVVATRELRDRMPATPPFLAEDVRANFRSSGAGETSRGIKQVLWDSPVRECDASFLILESIPPDVAPIPLCPFAAEMKDPAPRMYIIGHPGGRDTEISLYDNQLIACNETRLHYRTPTEEGSSGSPVFEPNNWSAVALHHSGKTTMSALDGSGKTYPANEGIPILAIQQATKRK